MNVTIDFSDVGFIENHFNFAKIAKLEIWKIFMINTTYKLWKVVKMASNLFIDAIFEISDIGLLGMIPILGRFAT
jgi:hypothetical protein